MRKRGKRKPTGGMHPIVRAQVRAKWNSEAVLAQIHALAGADCDKLLAHGSIMFFVASACAMHLGWTGDEPDMRIVRSSVNALDDLARRRTISDIDRGSLHAGMMAAQRIIEATPADVVDECAWLYTQHDKVYQLGKELT